MDDGPQLEGVEDAFPLTPPQAGMLFHTLSAPGDGVYLGVVDAVLPPDLDFAAFGAAWADVVARHQALRSLFVWDGVDAPVQVVREVAEPKLEMFDANDEPEQWLDELQRRGLDLGAAPPMRLVVAQGTGGARRFAWVCHHALIDDWSTGIVLSEVAALYAERTGGRPAALPPAASFRDFVDWLAAQDAKAAERHWRATFGDLSEQSRLPNLGPCEGSSPGARERVLEAEATARLVDVSRRLKVSLADVAAAAWGVVLHRLSGRDDVIFGQAVTLRPPVLPGIETAVGNFVATLPVRLRLDRHATLADLIRARHEAGIADREHAAVPLTRLNELSGCPRGTPLFETIVSMESPAPTRISAGERTLFEDVSSRDRSNYALAMLVHPGERLRIRAQFDPRQTRESTAGMALAMLTAALAALPDALDRPPVDLDVMDETERDRAEAGLVAAAPAPPPRLVHEAFAASAARSPDAAALRWPGGSLSYGELDSRAACLAGILAARGLGRGDRVALLLNRGPLMPLAMLAALRAGCAYIPLDPAHASDRTLAVLQGAGAALVMTDATGAAILPPNAPPSIRIDGNPEPSAGEPQRAAPEDIAYIMYTSGSTGAPKGVAVTHANLAHSTSARDTFYGAPPGRFLLLPSFAFDSSVAGLYWTIATGGTLVLPDAPALQDIGRLAAAMAEARVTHMLALPSLIDFIAERAPPAALASLTVVIAAGEPLTAGTVARCRAAFSGARLFNEYGPTEATVWCAACEVTAHGAGPVPIGGPIPGARLVLRDARGRPVPNGLPGELLVGGSGVAAGYVDLPDATAECFATAPDGTRLYRTGDLVRLRPDGLLDYLGRADNQVKIRGHRVEPAEIEAALTARPDIREAAVVPFGSPPDLRLAAFVTAEGAHLPRPPALRDDLRRRLPGWMVPERIILLDALPRTATGKLDRNALPPLDRDADPEILPPRTPLEKQLAAIWHRVLESDREIGVTDDFRELGGHSLLSLRLVGDIEAELGIALPLSAIASITTIADQAARIETAASRAQAGALRPAPSQVDNDDPFAALSEDELRQMHAYVAGWPGETAFDGSLFFVLNPAGTLPPLFWCFNGGEEFSALAAALGPDQPVFGLRTGNLVLDLSPATQQRDNRRLAMQALPELLRIRPDGAFRLGGNCQGAAVAMEFALALQGLGRNVAVVFLMEAIPMHAFHGRAALILGRDSEYNPFADFAAPELAWSRRYLRHSVDVISGAHGQFFGEPTVRELAAVLARRLAEAGADAPAYLADGDCRIEWSAPAAVAPFAPGERRSLALVARNAGGATWGPTPDSGLRLVGRWLGPGGESFHAGHADLTAGWPSGETRTVVLAVTAPRRPVAAALEIDMVEEGIAYFAERGAAPLRLEVKIDPSRRAPEERPAVAEGTAAPPEHAAPDFASLLDAARQANWKGAYREAKTLLAEAGTAAPALFAELGRAQAATGAAADAERSFKHALAIDPTCADALTGLGRVRLEAGRALKALLLFRRSLRSREDPQVRKLAKRAAVRLNLPRRALGRLGRAALRLGTRTR